MKKEELFQALHEVDEAFLDENVTEIKHSTGWVTAVFSIAACAALTAGLIYFVPKPARNTESLPAEEIKVMHSETTVTTVAETVTAVSADWNDNTSVNEEYQLYVNYNESDIMTKEDLKRPKTVKEILENISMPYIEICIDEKNGYISMLTAEDSDGLPKTGILTRTETGYDCQINDEQFFLQDISGYGLIFRSDKPIDDESITYDGRLLEPKNNADYLFQKIKTEEIASVSIYDTPQETISLNSEAVSEFIEIFRNIGFYSKSLSHKRGDYEIIIRLQDNTVYKLAPSQSFLLIDGTPCYVDEASLKSLAEFYEKYHLYDNSPEIITETTVTSIPVLKTTTVMENTHKNSESETSALVVETSGNLAPTHLPYITTENETQPSPSVLPNIQDNEPRQIETHYFETKPETTVKTTTTVTTTELPKETEPVTETPEIPTDTEPVIEAPEIPEYIQNIMYELDADGGTVFAREEGEHIEITVENGYYAESKFANALTYYPGKKYWVSMKVFYRDSDKESASIDQILTLNYGIDVRDCRINDGRFLALITEDDLETLRQIENMGFLIDLAPTADIEDNEIY